MQNNGNTEEGEEPKLKVITEADLAKTPDVVQVVNEDKNPVEFFGSRDLEKVKEDFDNPVEFQKELAGHMRQFIMHRSKQEMEEKGYYTDYLRRWIEVYSELTDKIEKNLHGSKSVNLNVNEVSHSAIGAKIRASMKQDGKKEIKNITDNNS